jgi:hypothetical protein
LSMEARLVAEDVVEEHHCLAVVRGFPMPEKANVSTLLESGSGCDILIASICNAPGQNR